MFSSRFSGEWRAVTDHAAARPAPPEWDSMPPGDPETGRFLWASGFGEGGESDGALLRAAESRKQGVFSGRLFHIVPIYVTSVCSESCLYCNFRGGNKGVGVERRRLSDRELEEEARYLVEEKGLRALELVYSTDPLNRADAICRHVGVLRSLLEKHGGGLVALNAESFEEDEYRRMRDAGLDCVLLWQETYDRDRYRELHPGRTKKSDFEYRLDSYERMIAAGIRNIGIGVLSGLSDWRRDWAMLMRHEAYLAGILGAPVSVLGLPRLKAAPGAVLNFTSFIPTSQEFLAATALHNLFSPGTLPFVSTREGWDMCVRQAAGGGCLFTLNCSTTPGGYSQRRDGCQFPVNSFDAPEYAPRLKSLGFTPEFSWSFEAARPRSGAAITGA